MPWKGDIRRQWPYAIPRTPPRRRVEVQMNDGRWLKTDEIGWWHLQNEAEDGPLVPVTADEARRLLGRPLPVAPEDRGYE